jgi:hypothetical protein
MKRRTLTAGAIIVMIELALQLSFLPRSRPAFAGSQDLLSYQGGNKVTSPCGGSTYETCPSPPCMCLSSTGTASGALTGTGFATFNLIITDNVVNGCQAYNGAMFIIAPKTWRKWTSVELRAMTGTLVPRPNKALFRVTM